MPLDSRFTVGQRVEVRFGSEWLVTRLEDFAADRLVLAWPTDRERRLLPLRVGDVVQIAVTTDDALYSAPVRVEQTRRDGVPLLTLTVVEEWERSQRRSAVRVRVAIRPRVCVRVGDPE